MKWRAPGGKCCKTGKILGEIRNLWSMTKKRSSEILADENGKFSRKSQNFSKIGGKSETGGKCIMASGGMDAPGGSSQAIIIISKPWIIAEFSCCCFCCYCY